jgi:hypothetical protein
MDRVIFTGRLSIHELQHERPLEYQRLLEEKRLEDYKIGPQSLWARIAGVLFGSIAVLIGLILLVLILLGQFYY